MVAGTIEISSYDMIYTNICNVKGFSYIINHQMGIQFLSSSTIYPEETSRGQFKKWKREKKNLPSMLVQSAK